MPEGVIGSRRRVGVELALGGDQIRGDEVPQLTEELRPRCEGRPVLVGDRDRHLGDRRKRADHLELLSGQLVEAVDDDGPLRPRISCGPQAGRDLARLRVPVGDPDRAGEPLALGEERGQLALVLAARLREVRERGRVHVGRLHLLLEVCEGGSEARPLRRAPEHGEIHAARRLARDPHGLRAGRSRAPGELERPRYLADEAAERDHGPTHQDPVGGELPLEELGVVSGRDDQEWIVRQGVPECLQREARAPRVRWPDDQRKRHRPHRSADNARKPRRPFCRRGATLTLARLTERKSPEENRI